MINHSLIKLARLALNTSASQFERESAAVLLFKIAARSRMDVPGLARALGYREQSRRNKVTVAPKL